MESFAEAFPVNGIFDCGVPGGDSGGGGDAAKEWWSGGGDGDGGHLCRRSFTRWTILLLVPNTSIVFFCGSLIINVSPKDINSSGFLMPAVRFLFIMRASS